MREEDEHEYPPYPNRFPSELNLLLTLFLPTINLLSNTFQTLSPPQEQYLKER